VDAAITVQLVLTLVEPQSSGIGGGAFLMHYDARRRIVRSYDGRETAPAAAKPTRFLKADGTPRAFPEAVFGGESVGVPGVLQMLALAHERHGRLPWPRLFEPAIILAEQGFAVTPRLNKLLTDMGAANFDKPARAYFFDAAGAPHGAGHMLKNPALAASYRAIAAGGANAFYAGPIAEALVAAVRSAPNHASDMTLEDLALYRAIERPAICVAYRGNRVCGMGPPSSGGLAIAQILKLVEPLGLGRTAMASDAIHRLAEAQKLAYADRDRFVADPAKVAVPATGMLDLAYLAERRRLIADDKAMAKAEPGNPPGAARRAGIDASRTSSGTTHLSIVDEQGNAVAMTSSIENAFGARIMVGGFLLNNQLTDFSFRPVDASGAPIANAVAPGMRPRSSMAPTIILDPQRRLRAALGSPGGSRIPLYTAKTIVGLIDWALDPQAAIDLPNFGSRNGPVEVETGLAPASLTADLIKRGQQVQAVEMNSGLHAIVRTRDGRLQGGADPRREGAARGD
jgi:gamma-glutamyltranspeptidase/glutathione hydrolase